MPELPFLPDAFADLNGQKRVGDCEVSLAGAVGNLPRNE
jgi:hypothetical protein